MSTITGLWFSHSDKLKLNWITSECCWYLGHRQNLTNCLVFFFFLVCIESPYQIWWAGKRMSFPAPSLPITKTSTAKSLNCHFDNTFYPRIFQYVRLSCTRLKYHIVTKQFWLLTTTRTTRYSFTLWFFFSLMFFLKTYKTEIGQIFTKIWPLPGNVTTPGSNPLRSFSLRGRTLQAHKQTKPLLI